jgi:hypothetical protein
MRWLTVCLCFLWVGCATTRIQVQDAQADIFMDGQNLGKGTAEISSIGPPHTANIEARKHGKPIGSTQMRRSFTFKTLLWGVFSYYTGFYWGWYYPEQVTIQTERFSGEDSESEPSTANPWVHPETSIWMKPL